MEEYADLSMGGLDPSIPELLQSCFRKDRMKGEYLFIKHKVEVLKAILPDYIMHTYGIKADCPIYLLTEQLNAMQSYLNILELRMKIEHID